MRKGLPGFIHLAGIVRTTRTNVAFHERRIGFCVGFPAIIRLALLGAGIAIAVILTHPPFHQHNSEPSSKREEQHQFVRHDEPRRRRAGLPGRIGSSPSFVANSAKADQQAQCIIAQTATEKAPP